MKSLKAMTPTERENNFAARVTAAGGRNLYTYLTPEANAVLMRLRDADPKRTIGGIVSEALVAFGMQPPEDSE